jgi:excisionase family DNA binding protein
MKRTTKATTIPREAHQTDTITEAGELLDIHQASKLLALEVATLRRWTFTRKIPHVKLGARSVRYRKGDLLKFIEAGERPALRPLNGR